MFAIYIYIYKCLIKNRTILLESYAIVVRISLLKMGMCICFMILKYIDSFWSSCCVLLCSQFTQRKTYDIIKLNIITALAKHVLKFKSQIFIILIGCIELFGCSKPANTSLPKNKIKILNFRFVFCYAFKWQYVNACIIIM